MKYIGQLLLIVGEFGDFLIHIGSPIDICLLGLSDGQVAPRDLHWIVLKKLHVVFVRVFEAGLFPCSSGLAHDALARF